MSETTTLSHNQFLDKYLRTAQKEPWFPTAECVWLVKLYVKEVYGIQLGSFGGTARSGWLNTKKTFDPKKWDRIEYKVGMVPKKWDLIFYDKPWLTGHTAVVQEANKLDIIVIEQNGQTGNWQGKNYDAINFETKRDYDSVLGWYRLR